MRKFFNTRFWRILLVIFALLIIVFLLYCYLEHAFVQVLARIETLREVEEIANTPGLVKTDQSEIDPKKFRKLNSFILWVLDKIFGPRLLCPLRGDFVHFFDFCLYK